MHQFLGQADRLLRRPIAHNKVEEFHILFLDRKNVLIRHERQQRGTVDHTPVYPREVVKRALELSASALILVHNHPSGDPTPSKADIAVTQEIKNAAAPLGVTCTTSDHRPRPPHQPARSGADLDLQCLSSRVSSASG